MARRAEIHLLEVVAIVLLLAGVAVLVTASVVAPTSPPGPSGPVEACEMVQLAVYPVDGEPDHGDVDEYGTLSPVQRAVFDEARAANGSFVRLRAADRMVAADSLAGHVRDSGLYYRAHAIRGNCRQRAWFSPLLDPFGRLLIGLGLLTGSGAAWRRLTY